ncbi:MAG TPA: DUF4229 domain-containing protein [Pseudonocardiaceae bacterium]|nr:DUF4229 domain-containing protein [Pseudonocardiaceae bacterium]
MGAPQIPPTGAALARAVALYSLARLALVVAVALLLVLAGVPLLVSILLALVVALPLSMVVFRSLRVQVATGLAAAGERRREERARLRSQLRGEQGHSAQF